MYELKTRYIVIRVPIPGIIGIEVLKISQKIPKNFVLIDGYIGSIVSMLPGTEPSCAISLSFSNKTSNPLILDAENYLGIVQKRKKEFLELKEQVQDGTYIQGFVEANNTAGFSCYVKIVLRGKKIVKID